MTVDSCDNINRLLSEFNSSMGSLSRETHIDMSSIHIDMSNNNWNEFIKYWLYGTATEINWFDKSCQIGWDYLKGACNINGGITLDYDNLYHSEKLVAISNNKPDYLVLGLGCLFTACTIFASIYYNLDTINAACIYIDRSIYNFLCMFDFPGFMIYNRSVLGLGPDLEYIVEHDWRFITDPPDGVFKLNHLTTYALYSESFGLLLQFNLLPPSWSIGSYLSLMIAPGWVWPFNYDNFHHITLFQF